MNSIIRYIIPLLILITGCTDSNTDKRLQRLADIVATSPTEVLDSLSLIDPSTLSSDQNYNYDFLKVKAQHHAQIPPQSDSLICRVIDQYHSKPHKSCNTEVLYYAGHIYANLNDYPLALAYLQQALNNSTPTDCPQLRCNILNQMAQLLFSLRLYSVAIPFIEESIQIAQTQNNPTQLTNNLQLIGNIYLRTHDYEAAKQALTKALHHHNNLPDTLNARTQMYLASVLCRLGETDSALNLIKNIHLRVSPNNQTCALAHSAYIYHTAGLHDSAYSCAQKVIQSPDSAYKIRMYQLILSPPYRQKMQHDTFDELSNQYHQLMSTYFDENEHQVAINQHALYNFQLHKKEQAEAQANNRQLRKWLIGGIIAICVLSIAALYFNVRYKAYVIKLHTALENVTQLEHILATKYPAQPLPPRSSLATAPHAGSAKESILVLRERLRSKLYTLYITSACAQTVSTQLVRSRAYHTLQEYIAEEREIKCDDPLWEELENAVAEISPTFKENLHILLGGRLSSFDFHTALLIKCGIPPTQMAILLNRVKGTIVSRRESICLRVFDQKMGTKVIDGIILLL